MTPGRGWPHWAGWLVWLLPLGLVGGMIAWTDDVVGAALRYAAEPLIDTFLPVHTEPRDSQPTAETSPRGQGPLVTVDVTPHLDSGCGTDGGWVFPVPPTRLADYVPGERPSRDGTTWERDPYGFGGAAPDALRLGLGVSMRGDRPIVLKDFTVHVVKRAKPVTGTVLDPRLVKERCGGGGESATPRWYGKKDLDTSPPRWTGTPPGTFPRKVTAATPLTLEIDVSTRHCACTWTGELHWSDGATSGTTTITDRGRPFRTTPADGLPAYAWDGTAWRVGKP
ncbi:hypothetical protein ACQKH1_00010 [Staphylococcus capitis]|uniref:hypothetical protein n=1 Tax=Staphylococcus capitis TaxID=29388 RepID=UPI003D00F167